MRNLQNECFNFERLLLFFTNKLKVDIYYQIKTNGRQEKYFHSDNSNSPLNICGAPN